MSSSSLCDKVQDVYASLHALLDELEVYRSFVVDISKMKEYREEFVVAIFLIALNSEVSSHICSELTTFYLSCPPFHVYCGFLQQHLLQFHTSPSWLMSLVVMAVVTRQEGGAILAGVI